MSVICERPACTLPVTGYIPLPQGLKRTAVYLCLLHQQEAREACYYTVSLLNGPDSEEMFFRRVREKHRQLRRTDQLLYLPGRNGGGDD